MKHTFIVLGLLLSSLNVAADEAQSYKFVSLGLEKNHYLADTANVAHNFGWAPTVGAGFGYRYYLNQDWLAEHELSIDYSKAKVTSFINATNSVENNITSSPNHNALEVNYGQIEALGFWSKNRLVRENLFENVSPYLEVDVGLVNLNYQNNNPHLSQANHMQNASDNVTAYKAIAGLKFNLKNDVDLKIGIGLSSDHKLTNNQF